MLEPIILFALGGAGYQAIELAWRGTTHWTMFAADLGLGGGGQVSIKDDQVVGALAGKLHQRVAVAYTGGNFFHISH